MYSLEEYLSVLFTLLQCYLVVNATEYVNLPCNFSRIPGKCQYVSDCPSAIESIEKTGSHGLERCGFVDMDEVVCCPLVAKPRTPESKQSSEEMVHEIDESDSLKNDPVQSLEGSKCESSGSSGICRRIENCFVAVESMKTTGVLGLDVCGFINLDKLVCCPPTMKPNSSNILNVTCKLSKIPGTCQYVRNCPSAIESLRETGSHGLERCGFVDLDEVVCCPLLAKSRPSASNDVLSTHVISNSKQFCERIKKERNTIPSYYIISGEETKITEYPHMAILGYDRNNILTWKCGASIISATFVLTAAHCIVLSRKIKLKTVRLGMTNLDDKNAQDYRIKSTIIHPEFKKREMHNDIALIQLDSDINFSDKTLPACLYLDNDDPTDLTATGWGVTDTNNFRMSNTLMKATLQPVSQSDCHKYYSERQLGNPHIVDTQICAVSNKSDTCYGDSGGPLQIKNKDIYYIVGITSFGAGCGKGNPGVYTRVSKFIDWIDGIVFNIEDKT